MIGKGRERGGIRKIEVSIGDDKIVFEATTSGSLVKPVTPNIIQQKISAKDIAKSGPLPPHGTVESLRTLIPEVFDLYTVDQDQAYWTNLRRRAPYDHQEAGGILDQAGVNPHIVAKLVYESEPLTKTVRGFNQTTKEESEYNILQLAWAILGLYSKDSQQKWTEKLKEIERRLQEKRTK